ncbi:MAG: recombinase family protein [Pseudonocardiaceae bacterium]|nr:recombinase family protein [Pseudonocardiaceae bacterium]
MAGPRQLADWAAAGGVGQTRSPYRRTPTTPEAGECGPAAAVLRVAWAGRTSTYDQQDPTLSLPRQLRACQLVLPEDALIVAHFYDIESGRKDLAARGRSTAHELFNIPIHRDGGLADLLAEAERPDRRFDYVICESIDRIARRTYIATDIENRLDRAGVRLLAADEPFQLAPTGGRKAKTATALLTRRVKQGISEFYVVEMLEKSWDGFAVHTEEGFNIGKPCYGYQARKIPHPVPAKRAKGQKKTFLEPDPAQAPVVQRIFAWRVEERLGYQAIADRLNTDPAANPPPTPVDPARAVGRWTASNVRDVLTNPKHTGYMVWNRHARKTRGNSTNPPAEWIWSPKPVHEHLVSVEIYLAAQEISAHRFGSRSGPGANTRHPATKRSYLLRTYLFCDLCGRRMFGKTRRGHAYYVCAPAKGYPADEHGGAGSCFVREDHLLDRISAFLAEHVFGAYRRHLLDAGLRTLDEEAQAERQGQAAALRRAIADADARIKRTVRNLELVDHPDQDLIRDINERRAELRAHRQRLDEQLTQAENKIRATPNPDLLDALPVLAFRFEDLPEHLARALFEALRLEIRFNKLLNRATCRITLKMRRCCTRSSRAPRRSAHSPNATLRRSTGCSRKLGCRSAASPI